MRYSYITDTSGKTTAIVIDIEVWNTVQRAYPEIMYTVVGNTFENSGPLFSRNTFSGEFLNRLEPGDLEIEGREN